MSAGSVPRPPGASPLVGDAGQDRQARPAHPSAPRSRQPHGLGAQVRPSVAPVPQGCQRGAHHETEGMGVGPM